MDTLQLNVTRQRYNPIPPLEGDPQWEPLPERVLAFLAEYAALCIKHGLVIESDPGYVGGAPMVCPLSTYGCDDPLGNVNTIDRRCLEF